MSRKERVLTSIDLVKTAIVILATAIFGLIGYAGVNFRQIEPILFIIIGVGLAILAVFVYLIVRYLARLLDELEIL